MNYSTIIQVPHIVFGKGSFSEADSLIERYRSGSFVLFVLDENPLLDCLAPRVPQKEGDLLVRVNTDKEPSTKLVDELMDKIRGLRPNAVPDLVVGIGGGSVLDIAKALSVLFTNPGSSAEYQGWNLVKVQGVPKLGIPTLAGTGSEASRTAVLTSPGKKFGINSEYSLYNVILLDPELLVTVPVEQRFYTGMDCYIHSVEALLGNRKNFYGEFYGQKALSICQDYFLRLQRDDQALMFASYLGGASIANSEVGIAHALSYGLSLVLGIRHGQACCLAFAKLADYYGSFVSEFHEMLRKNDVVMPTNLCANVTAEDLERMIDMTLKMERPLTNALGPDWPKIMTRDKIRDLFLSM